MGTRSHPRGEPGASPDFLPLANGRMIGKMTQAAPPMSNPHKTCGLSKSRLIAWRQCPKRLWLETYRPELREVDDAAQARFDVGNRVGEFARKLVPGGVLVEHQDNLTSALAETAELLGARPDIPLFEAAFQHEGLLVRADLLLPEEEGGYHLVEVKSTAGVKDYHLPDAAIQAWVAERTGLLLGRVSIGHLDTAFVYPGNGNYMGLFHREDVSDRIRPYKAEVEEWLGSARDVLAGELPDIAPGEQCTTPFDCPFQHHCWPKPAEYPVDLLPDRKGKALARKLASEGFADLRLVPEERFTDPNLQRIHHATASGQAYLNPQAAEELNALGWPRHYLDFETAGFAIPVWAGTRPFQALPFQWSCHIQTSDGQLSHADYLETQGEPPMRPFAESLLATLGQEGPILVYSGYERRILNEVAQAIPDLAPGIRQLTDRLFDLLPLTRAHYYQPAMKGSWSIKAVLPTVAPDLDYQALGEVQDGTAAQRAYGEIIDLATTAGRRNTLIQDLRDYCRLDTMAMVRLAGFLATGDRQ